MRLYKRRDILSKLIDHNKELELVEIILSDDNFLLQSDKCVLEIIFKQKDGLFIYFDMVLKQIKLKRSAYHNNKNIEQLIQSTHEEFDAFLERNPILHKQNQSFLTSEIHYKKIRTNDTGKYFLFQNEFGFTAMHEFNEDSNNNDFFSFIELNINFVNSTLFNQIEAVYFFSELFEKKINEDSLNFLIKHDLIHYIEDIKIFQDDFKNFINIDNNGEITEDSINFIKLNYKN